MKNDVSLCSLVSLQYCFCEMILLIIVCRYNFRLRTEEKEHLSQLDATEDH